MRKIRVHPITTELFIQDETQTLTTFGGTGLAAKGFERQCGKPVEEWEVAGEVASLADWQTSQRVAHLRLYVLADVWVPFPAPHGTAFKAGGPLAYIAVYAREHGGHATSVNAYLRRDQARLKAETLGGVAW